MRLVRGVAGALISLAGAACVSEHSFEGMQGSYRFSGASRSEPSLTLDDQGRYRFCLEGDCEIGTYSISSLSPLEGRITFVGAKLETFANSLLTAGRPAGEIPGWIVEPNGISEANFDRSVGSAGITIWIEALSESAFIKAG